MYLFPTSTTIELFTTQSRVLTTLMDSAFENIMGKGENGAYQHYLLFSHCFLPFQRQQLSFKPKLTILTCFLSARVAQLGACPTHDLVVVSSRPG